MTPAGRGSSGWATGRAGRRDRRDRPRLRPRLQPDPGPARNLRRNLALALETGKPAILHCRSADRAARRPGRARRGAPDGRGRRSGAGRRRSATGRRRSSTRSPGRSTTRATVIDLGLAISFSGLVFRRGEEASAEVAALVPGRPAARRDRFAVPGAARRPRSRNEPEWVRVTAAGSRTAAARRSRRSAPTLVAAYDRAFPSPGGRHDPCTAPPARPPLASFALVGRRLRARPRPARRRRAHPRASPSAAPRSRRPPSLADRERDPDRAASPSPAAACAVSPQTGTLPSDRFTDIRSSTDERADRLTFVFGNASLRGRPGRRRVRSRSRQPPYTHAASGAADRHDRAITCSRSASAGCRCPTTSGRTTYEGPPKFTPDLPALRHAVLYDASEGSWAGTSATTGQAV